MRTFEVLTCDRIDALPTIHQLSQVTRERPLQIVFAPAIQGIRQSVGDEWKKSLPDFIVAIHYKEPVIVVSRLISNEQITAHALFFETCAKDFRSLATQLIYDLASHFSETIDADNAMHTFGKIRRRQPAGLIGLWGYRIHGSHCAFTHQQTGQELEVYLITPLEFGILDPYFFVEYIKTTKRYQPMPIAIYEDYWEGERILIQMLALDKFERFPLLLKDHYNIMVKDDTRYSVD